MVSGKRGAHLTGSYVKNGNNIISSHTVCEDCYEKSIPKHIWKQLITKALTP